MLRFFLLVIETSLALRYSKQLDREHFPGAFTGAQAKAASMTKAGPYIFAFETVGGVFTSDFTQNQAAYDAHEMSISLTAQARAARARGENSAADELFREAGKWADIRDRSVSKMQDGK